MWYKRPWSAYQEQIIFTTWSSSSNLKLDVIKTTLTWRSLKKWSWAVWEEYYNHHRSFLLSTKTSSIGKSLPFSLFCRSKFKFIFQSHFCLSPSSFLWNYSSLFIPPICHIFRHIKNSGLFYPNLFENFHCPFEIWIIIDYWELVLFTGISNK